MGFRKNKIVIETYVAKRYSVGRWCIINNISKNVVKKEDGKIRLFKSHQEANNAAVNMNLDGVR